MSPQLEQILQAIDQLPLIEQTQLLQQLEQKIDRSSSNESPASLAQQQWQQAIITIRSQTLIDLEKQKVRISDMFAKFNEDEDEVEQQEALQVINSIASPHRF
jgi:ribosomal protein L7/L12